MINSKIVHDDFETYGEKYSDFDGEILIFEIYLSGQNEMATHVDIREGNFTYYQSEEEVLLMPMFTFQVTKVEKSREKVQVTINKDNKFWALVTTVTLAEIPYLSLIKIRTIFESTIVWYELKKMGPEVINLARWITDVGELDAALDHCQTRNEVFAAIDQSIRISIIVSCEEGVNFIEELFSGISMNFSICGIIIYDKDFEQKERTKRLVKKIMDWASAQKLPLLKKFSIDVATNRNELQEACSK